MNKKSLNIVIFGLSITSSWGNGHATTYRALLKALAKRGHRIIFFERDVPWYAANRDMPKVPRCELFLYSDLSEITRRYLRIINQGDFIIVGSYVPQGIELANKLFSIAQCPVGFYDIDTPVTIADLRRGKCQYLCANQIRRYCLYLSFTGGPMLDLLQEKYGSPLAKPLYCSVDTDRYFPEKKQKQFELGYLGTYSQDRQPSLDEFLLAPARKLKNKKFTVAGPKYPPDLPWPGNVKRTEHLPPDQHRNFYNSQRFTLNVTRRDMIKAGFSPSVRLFEAAACGTAIISDYWPGLEKFFEINKEILICNNRDDTISYLNEISNSRRIEIAHLARQRILKEHTADNRAAQLENYILELTGQKTRTHVS